MDADLELLRASFCKVAVFGDEFVKDFYGNFFKLAPDAEALFAVDMNIQRRKLLVSLTTILDSIENEQFNRSYLSYLGMKHQLDYNVLEEHYPYFEQAMMETLKKALGDEWTADVEEAWAEAVHYISGLMQL